MISKSARTSIIILVVLTLINILWISRYNYYECLGNNDIHDIPISSLEPPNTNDISSLEPTNIIEEEKFITYLPHSGLHNQRIALENAILLAWKLNRTLIVPPLILGHRSIQKKYLLSRLKSNRTSSLIECKSLSDESYVKECIDFHNLYTLIAWDELFDLSLIKKHVKLVYRKDFDSKNLEKLIGIKGRKDVLKIMNYYKDHKFFETHIPEEFKDDRRWKFHIIKDLHVQQKLLHFGDLFSSRRIIVQSKVTNYTFEKFKESITPNHAVMNLVVDSIVNKLTLGDDNFIGVHARIDDGNFRIFAEQNVHNLINLIKNNTKEEENLNYCDHTRIYLASDVPKDSSNLREFFIAFPCAFMLEDFNEDLDMLKSIVNPLDGTQMDKFLYPIVDLMIAANGIEVYLMSKKSTFGSYLYRYHNVLKSVHKIKNINKLPRVAGGHQH